MQKSAHEIVLATGNQGKVNELQAMLGENPTTAHWVIKPQSQWQFPEAEETGLAFVENAIIKARHACHHTGLPAIADDSGLAVDYLAGEPGVFSARYAGENCTDQDNINKVLAAMKDVPDEQRGATFHCVLVYLRHAADPTPLICHGQWSGRLLHESRGEGGFGYDPIFWIDSEQCSAAELSRPRKQQLSHRGKALSQLLSELTQ